MVKDNGSRAGQQLPICILTGFLGAGKTTLLNGILKSEHAAKTGVLVNDFGEIDIDSQLIETVTDDTVSLRNGCICCTMRTDFLEAVCKLIQRPDPSERLIVETSGVSDPSSIVDTLTHPDLARHLRVDSVVTVVDASEFLSLRPDERRLANAQVASADLVVINKAALVDERTLSAIDEQVRAIVPRARLLHTNHGEVPWALIFDDERVAVGGPAAGTGVPRPTGFEWSKLTVFRRVGPHAHARGSSRQPCCGDHSCGCADHREQHKAQRPSLTEAFESASAVIDDPLAMEALREVLRTLPREIYRLKGLFYVDVNPERQLLIQVVGERISAADVLSWGEKPRRSEVVAIGSKGHVSNGDLRRLFESCSMKVDAPHAPGIVARVSSWFRGSSSSSDG